MEMLFIGHAAAAISHSGVRLIFDPWLTGSAFNNGWDLLSAPAFTPADFQAGDFIWFSHEHPDHFSPDSLKAIPSAVRAEITVMYQLTPDNKVLDYCNKLGFRTRALGHGQRVDIGNNIHVCCGPQPFYDSWLYVQAGHVRLLNLNDCVLDAADVRNLAQQLGPIDVLMTQFANAEWAGNPDQADMRRQRNLQKLDRVDEQILALRPRYVIPFASFFCFSHVDNVYLNDAVNTPDDIVQRVNAAEVVVLYPGDRWQPDTTHDNTAALTAYAADRQAVAPRHHAGDSVPLPELVEKAAACVERGQRTNNTAVVWLCCNMGLIPKVYFWLVDLNERVAFDWRNGLTQAPGPATDNDVHTHSENLAFVLSFNWGMDTLTVNGRLQTSEAGYRRLIRAFAPAALNNTGRTLTFSGLFRGDLMNARTLHRAARLLTRQHTR